MSSPAAPASRAHPACSTASSMPSQTIDEITGQRSLTAAAVMRVTSARSRGVSEKTSPVWPLVIRAVTPGRLATHWLNRLSSISSMLRSLRNGTAMAGMMPWKLMAGTTASFDEWLTWAGDIELNVRYCVL